MSDVNLLENFETIAEAPGGVGILRSLILQLAVRGRLVPQDSSEDSADHLRSQLREGRSQMIEEGVVARPRHPDAVAVDDMPFSIPPSWSWVRLGDVGAIVGGGTPSTTESDLWSEGEGIAWLTPADMRGQTSRYVFRGTRDITDKGLAASSAQLLPVGSVLFSSRAPIGHIGIAAIPLTTNQGFKSCVPYEMAMSNYIYWFLSFAGPGIDASASGTTFKEVSGKDVALIEFPLPPLSEQQRIVAKIDELLGLCDELETCQQTRATFSVLARHSALNSITASKAIGDGEVAWTRVRDNWSLMTNNSNAVDDLRKLIIELGVWGRLTTTELMEVYPSAAVKALANEQGIQTKAMPYGWGLKLLTQVATLINGDRSSNYPSRDEFVDDGVPFVNAGHLRDGAIDFAKMNYISHSTYERLRSGKLREGDVIYCLRGSLGKTAVVSRGEWGAVASSLLLVRPSPEVLSEYLYLYLTSTTGERLIHYYDNGSAQPNLSGRDLGKFLIPIPPLEQQQRIVDQVRDLLRACQRIVDAIEQERFLAKELSTVIIGFESGAFNLSTEHPTSLLV